MYKGQGTFSSSPAQSSHQMASAAIRKRKWQCRCSWARASLLPLTPPVSPEAPGSLSRSCPAEMSACCLSMVSSQHQSEISVRRLSGHPPSSLPMCYHPSTTKPGRQQSLAGQWALDSGLHLDIPFPFKVSDGFPTKGDSTKGSPQ